MVEAATMETENTKISIIWATVIASFTVYGINVEHINKQLCKLMYIFMSRIFGGNDAK